MLSKTNLLLLLNFVAVIITEASLSDEIDEKHTLILPQEKSYRQFVVNRPYQKRFDLYKRFDLPTAHLYYPYGYEESMNIAE